MSDAGPYSRSPASLAFGVVSGDATARASLGIVCEEVGRIVSRVVYPQVLVSYAALTTELRKGALDLAWTPPLVALQVEEGRAAEVAACLRRASGAAYHSALFARRGLDLRTVQELEGKRAGWVDKGSLSGYLLARQWIRSHGGDPDRLFATESFRRTHSEVARAVLDGAVDVGATYANLDARGSAIKDAGWFEIGADNDAVSVIATIGPIPADAIVVSSRLAPPLRAALADALVRLPSPAFGAVRSLFHAEGFDRPEASHRAALARLRELR